MTLKVLDVFAAEGTEAECALYTSLVLDMLKQINDERKRKEAQKDIEAFRKLFETPYEELVRHETEGAAKSEEGSE